MADTAAPAPEGIPGADTAAPSLEEMAAALADQKIRATLSKFEEDLAAHMKAAEAAFADQKSRLEAQLNQMQGQLAAVRQQAGPPESLVLAASLATRVKTIAASNPDLGGLHFAGVADQAERLHEAVTSASNGTGTVQEATRLAQAVGSWFERSHPRISSKFLEGAHACLDEVERIIEALPELAPAAAAIASAI